MENLLEWFIYASYFSVLIPGYFFFFKKRNLTKKHLTILGCLLATAALSDLVGYILMMNQVPNLIVGNIYTVLEFLLISWMYWEFWEQQNRAFIKILVIVFLCVFIVDTLFIRGLFEMQNISLGVSSAALIFIAYRFYRVLQNLPTIVTKKLTEGRDVHFKTLYYINVGVFLYFVFNFWLFTLNPVVLEIFNEEAPVNLWVFHNAMNIVKNVFFAIGLYWAGRKELE